MKSLKGTIIALLPLLVLTTLCQCRSGEERSSSLDEDAPIVILYDNDVHCGIGGYAKMAGLRDAIKAADTAYVALVSSGDYIQGGTTGTLSRGSYIIDILNAVGYDVVNIGNHELDYGPERLMELTSNLQTPVICDNFTHYPSGERVFPPIRVMTFGQRKVAFIGVLTPSTLDSEGKAFYDQNLNQIYDLNAQTLYERIQQDVDSARQKLGADYVVMLSHLGEVEVDHTSTDVIQATSGIDVVLDAHTHSVVWGDTVLNKLGQPVLRTQTGTKFRYIGKLTIPTHGEITTELLRTEGIAEHSDRVAAVIDSVEQLNASLTQKVYGTNEQLLTISRDSTRVVRNEETNLANFVADAFRHYGNSQLAFVNGGGVRTDLQPGNVTYGNLLDVMPFSNQLSVIRIKGRQLVHLLETASKNCPAEDGEFIQPSGFRYTISLHAHPRVSGVEVLNPTTGKYAPIDMNARYTVTLQNYSINCYDQQLVCCPVIRQNIGEDIEAAYNYLRIGLRGHIGSEYAHPQGRIVIK